MPPQMVGWVDGWMDEWMDRQMDRQMDGETESYGEKHLKLFFLRFYLFVFYIHGCFACMHVWRPEEGFKSSES